MVKALGPKPEIVSAEEEDLLWVRGVMGVQNPKQLLYSIFYYCGLNLVWRTSLSLFDNLTAGRVWSQSTLLRVLLECNCGFKDTPSYRIMATTREPGETGHLVLH